MAMMTTHATPNVHTTPTLQRPEYADGSLQWYGVDLANIANSVGTPTHVCCLDAARASVDAFLAPFHAAGAQLEAHFSVKTNPVAAFIEALNDTVAGVEVVSQGELALARQMGFSGHRIVVNGLRGGAAQALQAAAAGVRMLNISTPGQLSVLLETAADLPQALNVGVTICPRLWRGYFDLSLNTAARAAPIGFWPGSADLRDALDAIAGHDRLKLRGLHMHLGSGIRSATPYVQALKVIEGEIMRSSHAADFRLLNIGGGYGLRAAPVMGLRRIFASLLGVASPVNTDSRGGSEVIGEVAHAVAGLQQRLVNAGLEIRFVAEPGRALSGPCQLVLLTVRETVERPRRRYVFCDGGAMSISPMLVTEAHQLMRLRARGANEPQHNYCVLGDLPTMLDRVSACARLPQLKPGDRIALLDTGGYFVSMSNTFRGGRPPIVAIDRGRTHVVRPREEDTFLHGTDLAGAAVLD